MIRKFSVIVAMMLFTQAVLLNAQSANQTLTASPKMEQGNNRHFDKMSQDLNLTDDQKQKMRALHEERKAQHQKDRELRKHRKSEQNSKVKSILNEEQYAKFSKHKQKKMKQKCKGKRKGKNLRN